MTINKHVEGYEEIKKVVEKQGIEILELCRNIDIKFPRSCDVASTALGLELLKEESITKQYDIFKARGAYVKNGGEDEIAECMSYDLEEFTSLEDLREGDFVKNECFSCGEFCGGVQVHSWLELVNRETKNIVILDITALQFLDNIDYILKEINAQKKTMEDVTERILSDFYKLDYASNLPRYVYTKKRTRLTDLKKGGVITIADLRYKKKKGHLIH